MQNNGKGNPNTEHRAYSPYRQPKKVDKYERPDYEIGGQNHTPEVNRGRGRMQPPYTPGCGIQPPDHIEETIPDLEIPPPEYNQGREIPQRYGQGREIPQQYSQGREIPQPQRGELGELGDIGNLNYEREPIYIPDMDNVPEPNMAKRNTSTREPDYRPEHNINESNPNTTEPDYIVEKNGLKDPFEDVEYFDILNVFLKKTNDLMDKVSMPSGTHDLISDFVKKYSDIHKDRDKNHKGNKYDAITLNNYQSTDNIGLRDNSLDNNRGVNELIHEGKNLLGKKVSMRVEDTEVSGQIAVTVFNSIVNDTKIFSHNLPSSGFSISLVDIPEVDIAKLAKLLNRATVRKTRETRGNLNSNYGMLAMKEILDFVSGYIYSTSINVDNYKIANYLRITDMQIVILLLMEYIHQKGFQIITSCANTTIYEGDKPKCDSVITANVDLQKLLVVDPDKLDTAARKHLSHTNTNAHSVEDVVRYQNTLSANDNKTYTIKSGNTPFKIELRNPTMTEAIEAYDQWENIVRDGVSDMTVGKNEEEIAELLYTHSLKTVLGMYLHFIVSISNDNGVYVVDRESIMDVLISFNSNRDVVTEIVKNIKEYIGGATVGLVGYTPYVCEKCGHENGGSDFIGLDMVSLGFHLVDLATLNLVSKPHTFYEKEI